MLSIRRAAPDLFTAESGGETLGHCRFIARGDTTVVYDIALTDPGDAGLFDGLARAALFAGLREGRVYGEFSPAVLERYGGWIRRFRLPEAKTAVDSLPRQCGGEDGRDANG